jgi:hypothetical protein
MSFIFKTVIQKKSTHEPFFCTLQMPKIIFEVLQRLMETGIRNAQKLKMGMRETAKILIPMRILASLSYYWHVMLKVIIDWYVSYTFFFSVIVIFVPSCVRGFHFTIRTDCIGNYKQISKCLLC